jgi:transposase
LIEDHPLSPCRRGDREALRVLLATRHGACVAKVSATNQLKALIVGAPEELRAELERLVAAVAPWLLELPGVGPISAAQVLVSWSHAGRLRSDAAFAALAGANPIPASSGQVIRHRLNRGGDRQLNRVLHTIVLARLRALRPVPTPPGDAARARASARFAAARSGRLPGSCSSCWNAIAAWV